MEIADFSQQVEDMAKVMTDSQNQTWESWQALITAFVPIHAVSDEADSGSSDGSDGRSATAEQPVPLPGAAALPAMKSVAEGIFAGYNLMLRMFELPGKAMTASTQPQNGSQGMDGLFPALGAGQNLVRLLGLSVEELRKLQLEGIQKLSGPWDAAWGQNGQAHSGEGGESALIRFSDLYWDNFERTVGRLLESPRAGHTREFEERSVRSSKAWFEFRSASFDYLVLLGEAWRKALMELQSELVAMGGQGKSITSLKELLHLWTEVADRVMIRTFSSESYARAQGRLLNAAMTYRLEERKAADSILKMSHLASRSEVDELGREIMELRRQLRAVAKNQRNSPAPPKAEAKPAPPKAEAKPAPPKAEAKPAPPKAEAKPAKEQAG